MPSSEMARTRSAGRKIARKFVEPGRGGLEDFRWQHPRLREGVDADGPEMLLPPDAFRGHFVDQRGDRFERYFLRPLRRIDIQILNIGKLRPLVDLQARDHGNLQIALAQGGDGS